MEPQAGARVTTSLLWWGSGIVLAALVLLAIEPSTSWSRELARSGPQWPGWVGTVLIIVLTAWFLLRLWTSRSRGVRHVAKAVASGVGVVAAYGTSELFKLVVAQERPCQGMVTIGDCPAEGNFSFPSNHATIAFAVATAIVLISDGWTRWLTYLVAVVVAVARVLYGVHFPHDVLAGALLGIGTTVAGAHLLAGPLGRLKVLRTRFT